MTLAARTTTRLRRTAEVGEAFFRIDWIDAKNYPLALLMRVLNALVPVVTYLFVAELVGDNGPDVAFDYYTFVVIGLVTMGALAASLNSFGNSMLRLVTQGQLEMFLVEPVGWRVLPFAMMSWPGLMAVIISVATLLFSVPLGASYRVSAIPAAFLILLLGSVATLAIGIAGASVKVLSKRSDPVLALYTIAASILSGAFYPIELLPGWLRAISWFIPHTYVMQALRRLLMPQGDVLAGPSTGMAILALIGFCLVAYPVALWVFDKALEYGRKIGALSGY
jgi:ABC-2 type transport system permease protein